MFEKLKAIPKDFKAGIRIYQCALNDERTPRLTERLLKFAIAYTLSPIDLIPDFIPIIGHIDDIIIVPIVVFIAIRLIPKEVTTDSRVKNKQ